MRSARTRGRDLGDLGFRFASMIIAASFASRTIRTVLQSDPSFPDFTNPNRVQVITVMFSYDPDSQTGRARRA